MATCPRKLANKLFCFLLCFHMKKIRYRSIGNSLLGRQCEHCEVGYKVFVVREKTSTRSGHHSRGVLVEDSRWYVNIDFCWWI